MQAMLRTFTFRRLIELFQLLFKSAYVVAVKGRPVLHFCVVFLFLVLWDHEL